MEMAVVGVPRWAGCIQSVGEVGLRPVLLLFHVDKSYR